MEELSARPHMITVADLRGGFVKGSIPGVVFSNGQNWVEQRRYEIDITSIKS